ncbi:hypothetical protein [Halolamina salifodinae]|uniref:Uncharacterized protein n=1 Tax=Halolamina salifodinae TaxID=1202767 RepID=A0A8T4GV40_9EURY|nr:hypothetical protein [Halolamina salifodinae]MBP1986759.1 hypothetical protein [Halolamina salifodinae]
MDRRQVLKGVVATLGLGVGVSGSASAASGPSSGVVVGVTDDDISPSKEVYYDTDKVPASHIDGYRRQDLDILAVTDTRDLDCDFQMTVHVCPREKNGMRLNNEWGAENQIENAILQKEEGERLLALSDVPASIELTEVGVNVTYDV